MATVINGFPFDARDFSADAEVPLVRIRDLTSPSFETFIDRDLVPGSAFIRNDDIIIGMDGEFNSILWKRGEAALNQRVCALRAHPDADPRYLAYAIPEHLQVINDLTWSTTVKHLAASKVRAIRIPARPLEEQREIADYLDRETTQIDAFIAKNEELIALLTERRSAVAAARFGANVGIGNRLKFKITEVDKRAGESWGDLPQLSVSITRGVQVREEDSASGDEIDLSHYKIAHAGEIVLNRMRAFQGGLGVAPTTGLVSPDYAVLRALPGTNADWLALVMRTSQFVSEMTQRLRGIGSTDSGAVRTPRISVAELGDILVKVPTPSAQATNLDEADSEMARIDRAAAVAQRAIELAKERRAALISAAVTGKIDVSKEASAA
ncbi:restriction endonuclease subunit S [Gulosibacter sediminis]|uniref:restriction endonuclease subunit S n=1 Tax=Gulosibacter sediminis TaxID=1729695 RepID=UPI003D15E9F6